MIDSHCHLTDPRLFDQLDVVLNRAAAAGISRMITIGTDIEDDNAAIALCQNRANLRCSIGIHPNYVTAESLSLVPFLRSMQSDPSVLALGEMGLDYFHKFAPRDLQQPVYEAQLQLAAELNRPVVIHSRESIDDCLACLKNQPKVRAVFHCFTGTVDEAKRILAAGYFLSFTGVVTFKKSDELRRVVEITPLDRMFVETDAPYLSPEPFRSQKTNEPALVIHTAKEIARIKGIEPAQIDRITTENAQAFFGWP